MLVLARGEQDTLERLGAGAALSLLLARSFPPFHDAGAMSETLRVLGAVVDSVPCLRFAFVPAPGAVRSVQQLLSQEGLARAGVR